MTFGPFAAWIVGQQVHTTPPADTMKPTLPIGASTRKQQPIRHADYPELPAYHWETILRMYDLYRWAGKERRWTHNEIAVELEYVMWELTKAARKKSGGGTGSDGRGKTG